MRNNPSAAKASPAPVFAALGDPTRFDMVARLGAEGPLSTMRLMGGGSLSRQAISKHLGALEHAGLVRSRRVGRDRVWELQVVRLAEARAHLADISAKWDEALGRLREFVEMDETKSS